MEALGTPAKAGAAVEKSSDESRRRYVNVNFEALKGALAQSSGVLTLNFFNDKSLRLALSRIEKGIEDSTVATGEIEGDPNSSVSLALVGRVLFVNVKSAENEASYEVRLAAENGELHVVRELGGSDAVADACETVDAVVEPDDEPIIETQGGDNSVMAAPVLDILVAYTPAARARVGGTSAIKALIHIGIADTNAALAGSGANMQVRLVGTLETKQNETGNYNSDLAALKGTTDSRWNEVHAVRKQLGADQVSLIGAYTRTYSPVGIGYYKATKSSAFTIVKYDTFKNYTFAHELGHNIGLDHSDGYQNSTARFRTIMAYGSYQRIRRYSNPNISYNGYKTGTSYNNSAKIINANNSRMASLVLQLIP